MCPSAPPIIPNSAKSLLDPVSKARDCNNHLLFDDEDFVALSLVKLNNSIAINSSDISLQPPQTASALPPLANARFQQSSSYATVPGNIHQVHVQQDQYNFHIQSPSFTPLSRNCPIQAQQPGAIPILGLLSSSSASNSAPISILPPISTLFPEQLRSQTQHRLTQTMPTEGGLKRASTHQLHPNHFSLLQSDDRSPPTFKQFKNSTGTDSDLHVPATAAAKAAPLLASNSTDRAPLQIRLQLPKPHPGAAGQMHSVPIAQVRIPSTTPVQTVVNFRNFAIQLGIRATNLTSNQHATAASDRQHLAAVMAESCLIASPEITDAFPDYRPTINNKLKPLKTMEFLHERLVGHVVGGQALNFASWRPQATLAGVLRIPDSPATRKDHSLHPPFRIFRRGRTLSVAIYRHGQRVFPLTNEEMGQFWKTSVTQNDEWIKFDLQPNDLVAICRGYNVLGTVGLDRLDAIAMEAETLGPTGDLDQALPGSGHVIGGEESACILARFCPDFDTPIIQGCRLFLKHSLHWEKLSGVSIESPWPYAVTKHSVLHRPYLGMLYLDASKINRFNPTIEYIVRKARAAPLGTDIVTTLGRLSDVQYIAGAMFQKDRILRVWSTSGAVPVHIRGCNVRLFDQEFWAHQLHSVTVTDVEAVIGDFILLLSPTVKAVWTASDLHVLISDYSPRLSGSFSARQTMIQAIAHRLPEESNAKHGIALFEVVDCLAEIPSLNIK